MSRAFDHKEHTKATRGPGGLHCRCCRIYRSIKASRTVHNRALRARHKAELRAELFNLEVE